MLQYSTISLLNGSEDHVVRCCGTMRGHTFAHLYSRHIHIHVAASHFFYPLLFEPQKSVVLDFTGQSPGIGANEVGHFYPKTQFFWIKCGFSHVICNHLSQLSLSPRQSIQKTGCKWLPLLDVRTFQRSAGKLTADIWEYNDNQWHVSTENNTVTTRINKLVKNQLPYGVLHQTSMWSSLKLCFIETLPLKVCF